MIRTLLLLVVLVGGGGGPASADPVDPEGFLVLAKWEGSVLTRRTTGAVAVLRGADGSLRWEVAVSPDTSLVDLTMRQGRGWTVVTGPDGKGTRNGWGEGWRSLETELGLTLRAATLAALHGPGDARRFVVPRDPVPLRSRLVTRGRGRGGPGEVLELRWPSPDEALLRSTRRPGKLRLTAWRRLPVRYAARESFVPIWALADLLTFSREYGNPPR